MMRNRRFKSLREGVLRTLAARGHVVVQEGDGWVHRYGGEIRRYDSQWEAIIDACRFISKEPPLQMTIAWN